MPHKLLVNELETAADEINKLTGRWVQLHLRRNRRSYTPESFTREEQDVRRLISEQSTNCRRLMTQYRGLRMPTKAERAAVSRVQRALAANDRALQKTAHQAAQNELKSIMAANQAPVYRIKLSAVLIALIPLILIALAWYLLSR